MKTAYNFLMRIGKLTGCHQLAERSFFVGRYQFPLCARCTGILAGNIFALIIWSVVKLPIIFSILFCALMGIDGIVQYLGFFSSTNRRRFVSGFLAGWGMTTLYVRCGIVFFNLFCE